LGTEADTNILTVTQLTTGIKTLFEETFPYLVVSGEISNYKRHSSGHSYFSLKDDRSQLRCVMWRTHSGKMTFQPEDGMEVIAEGALSVYEVQGQYQLIARRLKPVGLGSLQIAFEQLKKMLEKEGLFLDEHKQPLPPFPERVGVITSGSGAAISDIIKVIRRRAPWVSIVLRPTAVQGENAANDISTAIKEMNSYGKIDVLIVGRGGGSIEDLWAFNEEPVVRAIFDSKIPVISAVGHETDITLADFVADQRAPTPSGAAEMVVRDQVELSDRLNGSKKRMCGIMAGYMDRNRQRFNTLFSSYGFRRAVDQIAQYSQFTDELSRRLIDQNSHTNDTYNQTLSSLAGRLNTLSPLAVLERGYAVCQSSSNGKVVRSVGELQVDERVSVRLHEGEAVCRVEHLQGQSESSIFLSPKKRARGATASFSLFDELDSTEDT